MSLYRPKKSPHFHYDFVVKGSRFHGSTGTSNRRAAEAIEAKLRTDAAEGTVLKRRPQLTIDAAAQRFWEEKAKFEASHKTTEYQLANLVAGVDRDGAGKNLLISDIDGSKLATYVARRRAHVAPSSVNREIELLRRLMRRAQRVWGVDTGEQMPDWGAVMLPEPDQRVRELTDVEEAALFQHLRPDLHAIVRFAIMTGIRLTNVIRLTWPQVDFTNGLIRLMVKSVKPGGDVHTVPLTPAVVAMLGVERGRHPTYVFTYACVRTSKHRHRTLRYPFSKTGWRKPWKAALAAAKIDDFRFHDNRHTAATRTLRESGNLKVVQRMLGHKRIETTAKYAHAQVEDVRAAMAATQSRNSPGPMAIENDNALNAKK